MVREVGCIPWFLVELLGLMEVRTSALHLCHMRVCVQVCRDNKLTRHNTASIDAHRRYLSTCKLAP